jgi:hypothetical protein
MSSNTNFSEAMAAATGYDEPWYQSIGIDMKQATQAINDSWFCKEIQAEQNSFDANVFLSVRIKDLQDCSSFSIGRSNLVEARKNDSIATRIAAGNATHVTFELLRRKNPQWKTLLNSFIDEELHKHREKYGGLGSHRGFYTFVFPELCKTILARSITELWARPVLETALKTYSQKWVEKRFAPGGIGYFKTATHFELQAALQEQSSIV